jgi:thioredoxin-like negative regulator of GroEL
VREITDWGLAEALAEESPALLVAFVTRPDPEHAGFLPAFAERANAYEEGAVFRFLNVAENPSLIRKLRLRRFPTLILYAAGVEHSRWVEEVDLAEVTEAVDALLRTQEGRE